ncbi:hypothetical protein RISK_006567 [Rhodopirellula islandica]|uniref:Uncharacterized protein n=1 Tax=Rhodopirellula islandica TaxID=595434 RepID=A0A0J1B4N0_RHOIS|nr:hypothetical protein RISK_006567 [Rhodopirellula islandica]
MATSCRHFVAGARRHPIDPISRPNSIPIGRRAVLATQLSPDRDNTLSPRLTSVPTGTTHCCHVSPQSRQGRHAVATGVSPWKQTPQHPPSPEGATGLNPPAPPAVPPGLRRFVSLDTHRLAPMATSCRHFVAGARRHRIDPISRPNSIPTGRHTVLATHLSPDRDDMLAPRLNSVPTGTTCCRHGRQPVETSSPTTHQALKGRQESIRPHNLPSLRDFANSSPSIPIGWRRWLHPVATSWLVRGGIGSTRFRDRTPFQLDDTQSSQLNSVPTGTTRCRHDSPQSRSGRHVVATGVSPWKQTPQQPTKP